MEIEEEEAGKPEMKVDEEKKAKERRRALISENWMLRGWEWEREVEGEGEGEGRRIVISPPEKHDPCELVSGSGVRVGEGISGSVRYAKVMLSSHCHSLDDEAHTMVEDLNNMYHKVNMVPMHFSHNPSVWGNQYFLEHDRKGKSVINTG
jgi:hypothetical protein